MALTCTEAALTQPFPLFSIAVFSSSLQEDHKWLLKPMKNRLEGLTRSPSRISIRQQRAALTLHLGCPHVAVHPSRLLALRSSPSLWKELLLRLLSVRAPSCNGSIQWLSLEPLAINNGASPMRAHHMTATFHTRKAHQIQHAPSAKSQLRLQPTSLLHPVATHFHLCQL